MNGKLPNTSVSEWLIMNKLWEKAPLTAAEIVEKIQRKKDLSYSIKPFNNVRYSGIAR